jgi:hypothetical protein
MDLRVYYQKIRDCEARIEPDFPVVKSKETADGGKMGTLTEVPRRLAAKLIVDGMAELASDAEIEKLRSDVLKAKQAAEASAAVAAAMQLSLVPKQELDMLRANQIRGTKE